MSRHLGQSVAAAALRDALLVSPRPAGSSRPERTALVSSSALCTRSGVEPPDGVQRPQAAQPPGLRPCDRRRRSSPVHRDGLGPASGAVAFLKQSAAHGGHTSRSRCSLQLDQLLVGHSSPDPTCTGLRAAIADLVDAAVGAVPDFDVARVARLLVVPVDEVDVAVGPVAQVDEPRPGVVGQQEIRAVRGDEAGALRLRARPR